MCDLCRDVDVARVGVGIAGTWLAIGGIGDAHFFISRLRVLDATLHELDKLCAEGKDGVLSPPLVGLVSVNQLGLHINFGGMAVVEGVFVGQCRHDVANHINFIAAR